MESLLQRVQRETPAEIQSRSLQAMYWLRQRVQNLKINAESFYKSEYGKGELSKAKRQLEGRMYLFFYEPLGKKTLPYYDRFPLVLVIERLADGFIGLNLHYLPPLIRIRFLYELFKFEMIDDDQGMTEEDSYGQLQEDLRTKIRIKYDFMKDASKLRPFKPCIKRYKYSQIEGRALLISPDHWEAMSMLPLAQWKKAKQQKIWDESLEKIYGK